MKLVKYVPRDLWSNIFVNKIQDIKECDFFLFTEYNFVRICFLKMFTFYKWSTYVAYTFANRSDSRATKYGKGVKQPLSLIRASTRRFSLRTYTQPYVIAGIHLPSWKSLSGGNRANDYEKRVEEFNIEHAFKKVLIALFSMFT